MGDDFCGFVNMAIGILVFALLAIAVAFHDWYVGNAPVAVEVTLTGGEKVTGCRYTGDKEDNGFLFVRVKGEELHISANEIAGYKLFTEKAAEDRGCYPRNRSI
jgi:hypothetical protein